MPAPAAPRRGYPAPVAKRKPTSRPRPDRAPRPVSSARGRPGGRATGPAGPGPLRRVWGAAKKYSLALVLLAAIAVGAGVGIYQGRHPDQQGFGDANTTETTQAPFQSEQEAAKGQPTKEVFAHTCGTCHTLRAAGVKGIIGPDLDKAVLTTAKVRAMIRTGSLDTVMPKNLLVGKDADRVARYVARLSLASRRARERR